MNANLSFNTAARWVKLNLAVPIFFTIAGITAGSIYQSAEVSPASYEIITDNWARLTPATRHQVAAVMESSGKINRWNYSDILNAVLHDTEGFVMPSIDYDEQSARERLIEAIRSSGQQ